jgi:uroporphyrinogen decarboxylase
MTEHSILGRQHLLIRAARGEPVERPPVWAMRQAGRWDPEFNRLRAGKTFYEFSEDVELSAAASQLPRRFGVDAIILFYDITTLAVAMGLPFALEPGRGPVPNRPVRTMADVERLASSPDADRFGHVVELLAKVKAELRGELPVIAFAGAPFTLASYCIGTGKDLPATRRFAAEKPATWDALLDSIGSATVHFLGTMIEAGADAYQLFDSWAGMLRVEEYGNWAYAHHRTIFDAVTGVPSILFVKECPYLVEMTESGADVVSLGKSHDLAEARRRYPNKVFQGNVSDELMRTGTAQQVATATRACIEAGGGQRHIVNLSHGMDRDVPVPNFEAFVRTAKAGLASDQGL